MSRPDRPAVTDTGPADRALLRTPVRPPLSVADAQWNRWPVWRLDQRALDAIHADYRASPRRPPPARRG